MWVVWVDAMWCDVTPVRLPRPTVWSCRIHARHATSPPDRVTSRVTDHTGPDTQRITTSAVPLSQNDTLRHFWGPIHIYIHGSDQKWRFYNNILIQTIIFS